MPLNFVHCLSLLYLNEDFVWLSSETASFQTAAHVVSVGMEFGDVLRVQRVFRASERQEKRCVR